MDEDFEFEEKDEMEDGIDNEKHWKSLGIASAVISIICFLILMAIFILTPSNNSGLKQESYTLSEVVGKKIIQGNRFNGTWISGHEFLYQSSDKNIMIYDCHESRIKSITTKLNTTKIEIIRFEMSTSRRYVLLVASTPESSEKMANLECDPSLVYYIYDLTNENLINLQDKFQQLLKKEKLNHNDGDESWKGEEEESNKQDANKASRSFRSSCLIQSTQWNPLGNILLIMHHNDIYWLDMDPTHQTAHGFKRLTMDGSIKDSIYNGYNDYVYRDLIFERPTSVWWSPVNVDGHYLLAYLKINNSRLPLKQVLNYIDDGEGRHYRYSNINSSIGDVSLWLIEIDGGGNNPGNNNKFSSPLQIKPPDKLNGLGEYYLVHVTWINRDKIVVLWMLRNQKQSLLGSCERQNDWQCDELVTMKNWLHMNHVPQSILAAGSRIRLDDPAENPEELFFCGQTPENGVKTLHQLYSFNVKTKVINSYLNMAPAEPDSAQQQHQHQSFQLQQKYYQIIELLGHAPRSKWIFFVGKSLNQSLNNNNNNNNNNNDEQNSEISEQEMRINLFIFSIDFNTVHCITCQLVRCFRLKQQRLTPPVVKNKNNNNGNQPLNVCIDFKHSMVAAVDDDQQNENDDDDQDQDGESCIFQRIYMSPSSQYAIITCLIGIVPKVYLIRFTNIVHKDGDVAEEEQRLDLIENITLFEDNTDLENRMANKLMPNVESFVFTRENDNLIKYLRIKLLTPPDFNGEDLAKYPLLFEMYPSRNEFHHTQARKSSSNHHLNGRVFHTDAYPNIEWAVHMVTKHEFIYAWLDGHFYQDSNHSIHETSFEELIDDYSTLIDFIQTNMTFINPLKTCLIGNNIGAYFVLNSLATTSIQCGISISPFIDWNTINSFIAEQYINPDRIRSNDLQYLLKMTLNHKMLVDKNLLIIHGTSNELYPVRHTMKLMKRLTFDEQIRYVKEVNVVNEEFEINITNHHFLELYVDHGNSFDRIIEHFYIKIEFFLFQWIIV